MNIKDFEQMVELFSGGKLDKGLEFILDNAKRDQKSDPESSDQFAYIAHLINCDTNNIKTTIVDIDKELSELENIKEANRNIYKKIDEHKNKFPEYLQKLDETHELMSWIRDNTTHRQFFNDEIMGYDKNKIGILNPSVMIPFCTNKQEIDDACITLKSIISSDQSIIAPIQRLKNVNGLINKLHLIGRSMDLSEYDSTRPVTNASLYVIKGKYLEFTEKLKQIQGTNEHITTLLKNLEKYHGLQWKLQKTWDRENLLKIKGTIVCDFLSHITPRSTDLFQNQENEK